MTYLIEYWLPADPSVPAALIEVDADPDRPVHDLAEALWGLADRLYPREFAADVVSVLPGSTRVYSRNGGDREAIRIYRADPVDTIRLVGDDWIREE